MEDQTVIQLRDRIEELEEALHAATDVNRHLATEVERLSLECESYRAHVNRLRHRLKPRPDAPAERPVDTAEEPSTNHTPNYPGTPETDALAAVEEPDWGRLAAHARSQGWAVDPSQVTLGPVVGEGAFGATHRGVWRGAECAVKVVKAEDASAEAFSRELSALAVVRHPNVVGFYGAVVSPPDRCWLLCEWLPGGTLTQWLHGPPGARRAPDRSLLARLRMAADVAAGMEALEQHDPPILHRDLKPSNVMIDAAGRAKVADMGLSRVLTPAAMMELTPETGSYLYMAPEVVRHELYATQADVWSWGCLTSELMTGMRPYAERLLTPIQVALKVSEGGLRPAIPATCPPGLAELLASALDANPMARPSFAVVAAVMRRVVEEEERKAAAAAGGGVAAGVAAAWNRWMTPK